MGKRTLAAGCEAEGLELALAFLGERGMQAGPGSSIKDLATGLGVIPADLAALVAEALPGPDNNSEEKTP